MTILAKSGFSITYDPKQMSWAEHIVAQKSIFDMLAEIKDLNENEGTNKVRMKNFGPPPER